MFRSLNRSARARRGVPEKRKKNKEERNRRARACLVFPILWTLDPLSLGFNFWPPARHPPGASSARLSRRARGSSHVIRSRPTCRRIHEEHTMHATMLPVLVVVGRGGDVQCDSNQQPRPCQRALSVSPASPRNYSPLLSLFLVSSLASFLLSLSVFPSVSLSSTRGPWNSRASFADGHRLRTRVPNPPPEGSRDHRPPGGCR